MPTHYPGTREEVLALNTFIKFTRAYEALQTRLSHRGTTGDLTLSQFGVLEMLLHLGPQCQRAISDKLLTSSANITTVIDNLEKRKLVKRVRDKYDRRKLSVDLTANGRKHIAKLFPEHVQSILQEISVLTDSEQEQMARLCKKLGNGAA
ncbi:MAG: MarR family transcriptional regulator [bacterium]|nr:MarR family transcriptional regulator [bacterium]